jgi:hypothetical protein
MDRYCEMADKLMNSAALAGWMQSQAKTEGFPFSTPIETNVYRDIHNEVGEPSGMLEKPEYVAGFRQTLAPGRRADFIAMAKTIRETMKGEGKPVGNTMQCVIGNPNIITRAMGFASMADWGAAQNAGFSKDVAGIIAAAQANGPLFVWMWGQSNN